MIFSRVEKRDISHFEIILSERDDENVGIETQIGRAALTETYIEYELEDNQGYELTPVGVEHLDMLYGQTILKLDRLSIRSDKRMGGLGTELLLESMYTAQKKGYNYMIMNCCAFHPRGMETEDLVLWYGSHDFTVLLDQSHNFVMGRVL